MGAICQVRTHTEHANLLPFIVGCHWFTCFDYFCSPPLSPPPPLPTCICLWMMAMRLVLFAFGRDGWRDERTGQSVCRAMRMMIKCNGRLIYELCIVLRCFCWWLCQDLRKCEIWSACDSGNGWSYAGSNSRISTKAQPQYQPHPSPPCWAAFKMHRQFQTLTVRRVACAI